MPRRVTNQKKAGASYEALFIAESLKRGLDVHEPRGDYLSHDLLVSRDNRIFKIQVKGTSIYQKGKDKVCKVFAAKGRSGGKVQLTKEDTDIIAAYAAPAETWYLIPVDKITSIGVYLSPHNKYSEAKYELWKEAWNVFEG
jgi:hypothetical protein